MESCTGGRRESRRELFPWPKQPNYKHHTDRLGYERAQVIRILIADDVRILRNTLVAVLQLADDLDVVAATASGDQIVLSALQHRPDVAILDIALAGVDGLTAAAELHQRLPECRTLILTGPGKPGTCAAPWPPASAGS
jgi:CheY-like chemotaxis protein